jgi:glutaredoxin
MIVLYVLEGCPYCNNSLKLLKEYKIKHKAIVVQQDEKEYYKKRNKMNTFPQIFMMIDKDNFIKIGGNSDLVETIELSHNINKSNVSIDAVYYMYKNLYKK